MSITNATENLVWACDPYIGENINIILLDLSFWLKMCDPYIGDNIIKINAIIIVVMITICSWLSSILSSWSSSISSSWLSPSSILCACRPADLCELLWSDQCCLCSPHHIGNKPPPVIFHGVNLSSCWFERCWQIFWEQRSSQTPLVSSSSSRYTHYKRS